MRDVLILGLSEQNNKQRGKIVKKRQEKELKVKNEEKKKKKEKCYHASSRPTTFDAIATLILNRVRPVAQVLGGKQRALVIGVV